MATLMFSWSGLLIYAQFTGQWQRTKTRMNLLLQATRPTELFLMSLENHHAKLHLLFTDSILCETTDEPQG